MIVCDLGLCGRDTREDRGLADVGKADEADLGEHFKFKGNGSLLALGTALCKSWYLTGWGSKMAVAPAASAALAKDVFIGISHIVDNSARFLLAYESSRGDEYGNVLAVRAVHFSGHTVAARLGDELSFIAKGE